jgi:hypothetical protein
MKKIIVFIFFFLLSLCGKAQTNNSLTGLEIMQMQGRQLKTSDVESVQDIVQDAFMDLGWGGWTYKGSGPYSKNNGSNNAEVNITFNRDRRLTIIRIDLREYKGPDTSSIYDAAQYSALYAAIGKSVFLSSQKIQLETLK